MANERIFLTRNTGTKSVPVWERWFAYTVADAVLMSDSPDEDMNIKEYIDKKIQDLIGLSAPDTLDTLSEIAAWINDHQSISDALSAAITSKADKNHSHSTATYLSDGFMSKEDYAKLANIEACANNYTHPDSHSASMIDETEDRKFMTADEKTKLSSLIKINIATEAEDPKDPNSLCFIAVEQL